jgi:ATP-dependent protease Clp ATPase subunit
VARRVRQGQIGFQAEPVQVMDNELFQHVTTRDFIEYGFEPEFIGRLPVRVVCEDLDADDLFSIMKYSEGSLLRQYERAFRAYGIEISFEEEALQLLAEAAAKEQTGARGLLTVFEKLFRDGVAACWLVCCWWSYLSFHGSALFIEYSSSRFPQFSRWYLHSQSLKAGRLSYGETIRIW